MPIFSNLELRNRLREFTTIRTPHLEVREFLREEFELSAIDQAIEVHRGSKAEFPSPVCFWISSLAKQQWISHEKFLEYAERCLCADLTEREFHSLIKEYTFSLAKSFAIEPNGSFFGALRMHARPNDLALLAEFEREYVAFYWHT